MKNLTKPKFWDKKTLSVISILLLPLTLITIIIIFFKKLFSKIENFEIPIICVGNVYVGGTGKTPTSIYIANELLNLGFEPVILRKFYQNHSDEYKQIKNNFRNLIVKKNRAIGIDEAKKRNFKTVILDDGLQDYKIKKNLSIVCFNSSQLIGNGLIMPSGPLRESLNALKNTDIVIINGNKDYTFEKRILEINKNIEIFYSYYKPENINQFKNQKVLALAGIANPDNFFMLLEKNNLIIEKKIIFPDHYMFNKEEVKKIIEEAKEKNLKIIMTEKDFFKVSDFEFTELNYIKVSLIIHNKEKLISKIKQIYD